VRLRLRLRLRARVSHCVNYSLADALEAKTMPG
jgi:hypothetical protein